MDTAIGILMSNPATLKIMIENNHWRLIYLEMCLTYQMQLSLGFLAELSHLYELN